MISRFIPSRNVALTGLSLALSLAMAVVVIRELAALNWREIIALVPANPLFWIVFLAFLLNGPVADWFAFRRAWDIRPAAIGALIRKQVYSEVVLGYLGEAYFYLWARRKGFERPFSVVKDVAILSAFAGNLITVLLVALVWRDVSEAVLASGRSEFTWSLIFVLVVSVVIMLAQKRVFLLPARDLWAIFGIHCARKSATTVLAVLLWYLILPEVELYWWLYLVTLRQLVTRLPLVANKDLVFAGLAVLLLGDQPEIAATMALSAGLLVAGNVLAGVVLLRGEVAEVWRLIRQGPDAVQPATEPTAN